ncbi:hypothetical protein E4T56_gene10777 [Termitomyces sp. T112]|nr:hypothetical protein E4T56_gene10777 [Termitomyces sp. T112]
MAYPAYDNFTHSHSRRQSIGYGTPVSYQHPIYPDNYSYSEYPQPSYQLYGAPARAATMPMPVTHRLTSPSYDDLDIRNPYYLNDQYSSGHLPGVPHSSVVMNPRHRRHSTVSYTTRPAPMLDTYHLPGSLKIKFRRKGSFSAGITLREAQDHYIRLSGNDSYSLYDFHGDGHNRILLRIQWAGYASMTYDIPLDTYDGRVSLQTVARRISRACVHYLQANIIPVVWDRVELHHLEEVSYGVWQPMLSTR